MVTFENAFYKFPGIVRNISNLMNRIRFIKIPFHFYDPGFGWRKVSRFHVREIFAWVVDHRHHSPVNGAISSEKIKEGNGND